MTRRSLTALESKLLCICWRRSMLCCGFSEVEVGGPVDEVDGVGVRVGGATVMADVCVVGLV